MNFESLLIEKRLLCSDVVLLLAVEAFRKEGVHALNLENNVQSKLGVKYEGKQH